MTTTRQPARVRFAPSPTGYLHLGSLRTALFNWLYARRTGGQFLLRIEDTDQNRYVPDSVENLMRGLRWTGLEWDEGPDKGGPFGPYVQSERKAIYADYAERLIAGGHAYRCYVTAAELDEMRREQEARGEAPGYDRRHRYLTDAQRTAFAAEGRPSVVRLAAPLDGTTTVHDLIRGQVTVDNERVRDPVLLKSDGMPTYHLAVVVDDHLMEITHALRGEEWLPSAPLHKLLYDAFGWQPPVFVHLPVILDPNGGKLSKRKRVVDGKEQLVMVFEFIEAGYLPEALINLLTNVGWNFDAEREVFTPEEAIARFDVADINPAPAIFPYPKLDWLNGVYIRAMAPAELKERLIPFLSRDLQIAPEVLAADERLTALIPLIQERLKLLTEAAEKVDWAFCQADEIRYDDLSVLIGPKLTAEQSLEVLEGGLVLLVEIEPFEPAALEAAFRKAADARGLKPGSFFSPFRGAVTGKSVSPPLFESMAVLGREETIRRLERACAALRARDAERV